MSNVDCIIIGAGVSGLSTAYHLKKLGRSFIILEEKNRVGGVLKRITKEGYHLELGANSFLLKPELVDLLDELELQVIEAQPVVKNRFVCLEHNEQWNLYKVPQSLLEFLKTPMLSFFSKLRLFLEVFSNRGFEDQSVYEFISNHFGKACASRLAAPGLNGIYAADIQKLSARSALPFFWNLEKEYGSITAGLLFGRRHNGRSRIVQLVGGMEALPLAFAIRLGENLRLNSKVKSINSTNEVELENGQKIKGKCIVLATEASATNRILEALDKPLAEEVGNIPYSPLGLLYVVGDKHDVTASLSGVGFLKQSKANSPLLGILFTSSFFPECSELSSNSSKVLLTCFVGGMTNPELSDVTNELHAETALREAKQILGLGDSYRIIHSVYWSKAIPNYPIGHFKLVEKVKMFEQKQIFISSNWLERPGLGDCILRGKDIAKRVSLSLSDNY